MGKKKFCLLCDWFTVDIVGISRIVGIVNKTLRGNAVEKILDYGRRFEAWMHKPTEIKDPNKVRDTVVLILVVSCLLMFMFG